MRRHSGFSICLGGHEQREYHHLVMLCVFTVWIIVTYLAGTDMPR
jgi:hypothetical protein